MAEWKLRRFEELSAGELYDCLILRSDVFVVEQNCAYLDPDRKDRKAWHVIGINDGKTVAYSRIFAAGDYFENASIGRVVVDKSFRGNKTGDDLMKFSIESVQKIFGESPITISAQEYLRNFYNRHGFLQEGEGYLEDDIPHIRMHRK